MKLRVILEVLALCALVAFATARVIDSRTYDDDFTSRLLSNVSSSKTEKHRQNEITVGGPDYDDVIGSQEIVVGEEDLITNNVPTDSVSSAVAASTSGSASLEDNNVSLPADDNTEAPVNVDDAHPLNRYCTCNEAECNCCREFKLPLVSVRGPGCASLRYLGKNRMTIAIKYGDITLTSRTISGRKARPVCLNLPGGYSQFCGRVYGISRESDDFQACLGLELRAEEEVEAALRVSCFKFGPKGLKMTDAQPLPPVTDADDDEDDDAGGLLGLVTGAGDSDEEEDYDDEDEEEATGQDATTGDDDADLIGFADDDEDDDDDDDDDEDADDLEDDDDDDVAPAGAGADYPSGFSLLDGFFGESSNKKKKPVQTRNKVNTPLEDVKEKKAGAKVKIANSPAILNSAALSQNEVDNTIPKDTVSAFDPVDLAPAVEAAVEAAAAATPLAEEKPKPAVAAAAASAESSIIADLQSNAGVPLVSTTKKPKKKPASFLETIESFISGGDDDDDDDEEADDTTKDEEDDDDDEEEEEVEADDDDDEEEEEKDDEEKDEEEKDEEEKDEDEKEEEEKDEEEDDEEEEEENDDEESSINDKESLGEKTDKKTKKKNDYGLGFFARLMKFI